MTTHGDDTIRAIAAEHARDIEDQLTPEQRRECFHAEACFDDYMDTWASLRAAFACVVGRDAWTLDDLDGGRCTAADVDADADAIYAALEASDYMVN